MNHESTVRGLLWLGPGVGSMVLLSSEPDLDLAMLGLAYFLYLPLLVFLSTGRLGRCMNQFGLTLVLGFIAVIGFSTIAEQTCRVPGFMLMWFLGIQFGVANFLTPQRVNLLSLLGQALPILALAWRAHAHPLAALMGMMLAMVSLVLGSVVGRMVKDQAQADPMYGP